MDAVAKVPVENLPRLEEEIASLNKRAARLGLPPIELRELETITERKEDEFGFTYNVEYKRVRVRGEAPRLADWSLAAAITPQPNGENLIRPVPGEEVPAKYRNATTYCDHCETRRYRKDVFILRHPKNGFRQVGRNCLQDFLGGVSPESLLAEATRVFDLVSVLGDAEGDAEWGGGGRGERVVGIARFLAVTAVCVRRLGWVSRGKAKEDPVAVPTADIAWRLCTSPSREVAKMVEEFSLHAEERDSELAEKALAWAKGLPTQGVEEYIYNLGVACRQETVKRQTIGLAASAITAYQRHQDREAERKQRKSQGKHVGTVGERRGFPRLKVKAIRSFEGEHGVKTLIRFEDRKGNVLTWWAAGSRSSEWLHEGDTVDVVGTVKRHVVYKGEPQTVLSRVVKGKP